MRKLKLAIDNLKVESFDTSEIRAERRGTVLAASGIEPAPFSEAPCIDSDFTGPCCDITLVLSCVQTSCIPECNSFDVEVCPG